VLFTQYLLPFEMVGIILLVAIVGVVVLNRGKQQAAAMEAEHQEPETPTEPSVQIEALQTE
jgi:hypothetical protein